MCSLFIRSSSSSSPPQSFFFLLFILLLLHILSPQFADSTLPPDDSLRSLSVSDLPFPTPSFSSSSPSPSSSPSSLWRPHYTTGALPHFSTIMKIANQKMLEKNKRTNADVIKPQTHVSSHSSLLFSANITSTNPLDSIYCDVASNFTGNILCNTTGVTTTTFTCSVLGPTGSTIGFVSCGFINNCQPIYRYPLTVIDNWNPGGAAIFSLILLIYFLAAFHILQKWYLDPLATFLISYFKLHQVHGGSFLLNMFDILPTMGINLWSLWFTSVDLGVGVVMGASVANLLFLPGISIYYLLYTIPFALYVPLFWFRTVRDCVMFGFGMVLIAIIAIGTTEVTWSLTIPSLIVFIVYCFLFRYSRQIFHQLSHSLDQTSIILASEDPEINENLKLQKFLDSPWFNLGITFVIFLSVAGVIWEEVNPPPWLGIVNDVFSAIFIIECVVKQFAFGALGYWSDPLNAFDGVLVILVVFELTFSAGNIANSVRVVRLFRFLRALRSMRAIRLTHNVKFKDGGISFQRSDTNRKAQLKKNAENVQRIKELANKSAEADIIALENPHAIPAPVIQEEVEGEGNGHQSSQLHNRSRPHTRDNNNEDDINKKLNIASPSMGEHAYPAIVNQQQSDTTSSSSVLSFNNNDPTIGSNVGSPLLQSQPQPPISPPSQRPRLVITIKKDNKNQSGTSSSGAEGAPNSSANNSNRNSVNNGAVFLPGQSDSIDSSSNPIPRHVHMPIGGPSSLQYYPPVTAATESKVRSTPPVPSNDVTDLNTDLNNEQVKSVPSLSSLVQDLPQSTATTDLNNISSPTQQSIRSIPGIRSVGVGGGGGVVGSSHDHGGLDSYPLHRSSSRNIVHHSDSRSDLDRSNNNQQHLNHDESESELDSDFSESDMSSSDESESEYEDSRRDHHDEQHSHSHHHHPIPSHPASTQQQAVPSSSSSSHPILHPSPTQESQLQGGGAGGVGQSSAAPAPMARSITNSSLGISGYLGNINHPPPTSEIIQHQESTHSSRIDINTINSHHGGVGVGMNTMNNKNRPRRAERRAKKHQIWSMFPEQFSWLKMPVAIFCFILMLAIVIFTIVLSVLQLYIQVGF